MASLSTPSGRLHVTIERAQSSGDDLTGAMGRGVGLAQLGREIYRAGRHGSELAVALLDLDGLRVVNNRDGHTAGDRLLRLLVERLLSNMRPYDLVVRMAGDEFLCVMPDADADTARARIAVVAAGSWDGTQTPSFRAGVAAVQRGDTSEALVGRADADLRSRRAASVQH